MGAPQISIGDRSYVLMSKSSSENERQLQLLGASPRPTSTCNCVHKKSDSPSIFWSFQNNSLPRQIGGGSQSRAIVTLLKPRRWSFILAKHIRIAFQIRIGEGGQSRGRPSLISIVGRPYNLMSKSLSEKERKFQLLWTLPTVPNRL